MNIPNFKPSPVGETKIELKIEPKIENQCGGERLAETAVPWMPAEIAAASAIILAKNMLELRRPGESLEEMAERMKCCVLNMMREMQRHAE
jgi:hypothetical protein